MLMERDRSALMLIDWQERLLPALEGADAALTNAVRLQTAARRLGVPMVATEQYPKGLGRTDPRLGEGLQPDEILEKTSFNAAAEPAVAASVDRLRRPLFVLAGAEAHVCVGQTALGLLARGYRVAVVADGVASRREADKQLGLQRLRDAGVQIVSTEMVLFEWIGRAATPEFRDLLELIK